MKRESEILAALGNEHRLKIVEFLRVGECCVCEITPRFELDPSVVSRHLATLERAGIVASRRDGRWIHYRIADPRVLRLLAAAGSLAGQRNPDRPRAARRARPC
jgi:ArsR family transcriptional regulator